MNRRRSRRFSTSLLTVVFVATAGPGYAATTISSCRDITSPGAYQLVQNMTFSSTDKPACINIKASDVTLDLQGYTIKGNGLASGVLANGSQVDLSNIEVRNGTIRGFREGLFLRLESGARAERLRMLDNTSTGIFVDTELGGSVVASNIVTGNDSGIFVSGSSLVADNNVSENRRSGLDIRANAVVRGNVAVENGSFGIVAFCPSVVVDNTAVRNVNADLLIGGAGCRVFNNAAPVTTN